MLRWIKRWISRRNKTEASESLLQWLDDNPDFRERYEKYHGNNQHGR